MKKKVTKKGTRTAAKKKSVRKTTSRGRKRSAAGTKGVVETKITISSPGGVCMVVKEAKIRAQRNQAVRWRIINDCLHDHRVRIAFAVDPLKPCTKEKNVPAGAERPINCRVKGSTPDNRYPYDVHVDGNIIDPELEVRGPLIPDKKPRRRGALGVKGRKSNATTRPRPKRSARGNKK